MSDRWELASKIVGRLLRESYPSAVAAFVGGSFARGDATPTSDIDLVVLFQSVNHAWRETLAVDGTTVEAFCHDPKTFEYFCENVDRPSGQIPLGQMVAEGRNLMATSSIGDSVRHLALKFVTEGPPKLTPDKIAMRRYYITTLLEDLVDAVRPNEVLAIGGNLFESLGDFALRIECRWSGRGKQLARNLIALDQRLASDLDQALRQLVTDADTGKRAFESLTDRVLDPHGGRLLIGYRSDAPPEWHV